MFYDGLSPSFPWSWNLLALWFFVIECFWNNYTTIPNKTEKSLGYITWVPQMWHFGKLEQISPRMLTWVWWCSLLWITRAIPLCLVMEEDLRVQRDTGAFQIRPLTVAVTLWLHLLHRRLSADRRVSGPEGKDFWHYFWQAPSPSSGGSVLPVVRWALVRWPRNGPAATRHQVWGLLFLNALLLPGLEAHRFPLLSPHFKFSFSCLLCHFQGL